jgi:hypothetical protein
MSRSAFQSEREPLPKTCTHQSKGAFSLQQAGKRAPNMERETAKQLSAMTDEGAFERLSASSREVALCASLTLVAAGAGCGVASFSCADHGPRSKEQPHSVIASNEAIAAREDRNGKLRNGDRAAERPSLKNTRAANSALVARRLPNAGSKQQHGPFGPRHGSKR